MFKRALSMIMRSRLHSCGSYVSQCMRHKDPVAWWGVFQLAESIFDKFLVGYSLLCLGLRLFAAGWALALVASSCN